MNSETIVYCVVALLLGMLLANMLKNICGCKVVEGQSCGDYGMDVFGTCDCYDGFEGTDCQVDIKMVPCVPASLKWNLCGNMDSLPAEASPEIWSKCSEYTLPNCGNDEQCKPNPNGIMQPGCSYLS